MKNMCRNIVLYLSIKTCFIFISCFVLQLLCQRFTEYVHVVFKSKYRKDMEDLPSTLYSLLPETLETQFVKEMAETHSEVKYREAGKKEASSSLYHRLPETLETLRVKEVTELQSEVQTSIIHTHPFFITEYFSIKTLHSLYS
ncbi:hypothetical protein CHARACLAT_032868 [Characodon lateralis]|uniref:Uncharacterized protein n=1 Tax=Characodon lateralis TaxID=208331 RepID=A0ABU7D2L7_9TELE|nr:hypothetical protein [Characodon lateralis]